MNNNTFVIFSSINWKEHSQLHHQLTNSLLKEDCQILFIENIGTRTLKFSDFFRIINRIKVRLSGFRGFSKDSDNLIIHSPIFIPLPYNSIAIKINSFLLSKAINKWKSALHINKFSVISFLPTPSVQSTIRKIGPNLSIYYCADDMSRSLKNKNKYQIKDFERVFFQMTDLVFVTSTKLKIYAEQHSNSVHMFPCGVDFDKFSLGAINREIDLPSTLIIGYIGAISSVFDQELIYKMAKSLGSASICLVGPICTNIDRIKSLNNVYFFGSKDHKEIPSYIRGFDVAIIPYIVNDVTSSVYPCKLNEYLATGKPVVSTQFDEIVLFNKNNNNVLMIGSDHDDFISNIKIALDPNSEINNTNIVSHRIAVAAENSWSNRFKNIKNIIESSSQESNKEKINWSGAIRSEFQNNNVRRVAILFFTLYLISFYTPLFPLLGEVLIIRDNAIKSDVIVVISGTGEGGYRNSGYQKRALDSIKYYKDGYADKVLLSSGREQTISEVELMQAFIQNNGVQNSDILILKEYPSSTYDSVLLINKMLDKHDLDSVLLITSPYHSLRFKLIWNKNIEDKIVFFPSVIDTPSNNIEWSIKYDTLKLIVYEYSAIVYNWIKGRI